MKKKPFYFLFIFIIAIFYSQQNYKIPVFSKEVKKLFVLRENGQAFTLLDNIEFEAKAHEDWKALAYVYAWKGLINCKIDKYKEAKSFFSKAKEYAEKSNDNHTKAFVCTKIGEFYGILELYDLDIKETQKALMYLGKENDYALLGNIYHNFSYAYSMWENPKLTEKYARLAYKYSQLGNDKYDISDACISMSNALDVKQGKGNKTYIDSIKYYDEQNFKICQKYIKECGDNAYSIAALNMASFYFSFYPNDTQAKEKAFYYLNLLKEKNETSSKPIHLVLANMYGMMAGYAEKEGDKIKAEDLYHMVEKELEQDPKPNYDTKVTLYNYLADFYEGKKNYLASLMYRKKMDNIKEKLYSQQQIKNAQKLEVQYEVEKKDDELLALKEQEKTRRLQNVLFLGIGIISVLGLVFMYRAYYFRLKYSQQKEKQSSIQVQEAKTLLKLKEQEQEKLRLEQELLTMKQEQLQKEVMARTLQIDRKNEMLQQIKDKVTEGETREVTKMIKEEMLVNNDFEKVQLQIKELHPNFFRQLNEISGNKLSQLDLKYCAYIYLQMDTKQIANLFHVEAKSVRMTKYRIKQKLELSKDDDLDKFLQTIG